LGHNECGPNKISYETVIKAWSNSGHPDAEREIVALREEMKSNARHHRSTGNAKS
jgi:hypothetical protein